MKKGMLLSLGMLVITMMNVGCMRPYQEPVFVEVKPHEAAFVIPLEGDTGKQGSFMSSDLLLSKKVSAKRIEIPTRWVKTGRAFLGIWDINGEWKHTVMVLTVDRTPISKQFTPSEKTGTSIKNQGLYAESQDSIGLSSGFAITAVIEEQNAHLFLNKFKGDSLATVMDNQLLNSCQAIYTEVCNKYDLKALRSKKQEITDNMREKIIPMYKEWGITINPDMGLIGGFSYEDKEIQVAINKVFINQTMQAANEALKDAQQALNEQQMSAQSNTAAMFLVTKEAEAAGILKVAEAINKAGPMFIQNKQLEVMSDAIKAWNGTLPQFMGGSTMPMMFNMPVPDNNMNTNAVAVTK